ncbi:Saposin-like type B, 1 domain and Saposin B domain and Saposin-like domain-containing protein [Strongyloides ratti]|uniref:Saposin-like type B, 1 domain and Saposin B domain and Saposin-like domain-containing protein n=1 Tax=Strongyloides ratti TaxID=34506 RepID=A0A090LUZ9_STRRB|nr:Saposin-like type B, 1 domain and Saposin B domain and Saposin-like domain-containing protein [Strongyloides ratti]CEF71479.1 Saposin-like type B, 1 domain and Saposin B domain and Saposin-like domain-containing protein [Strongyloides ratti]
MKNLTVFFLVLLSTTVTLAIKDELLDSNKIPKVSTYDIEITKDVCDECQTIVSRFSEAMRDPSKLAALKLILGSLCHETVYEMECKLFVRKLDVFMDKLLPYLNDTKKVCHKFHMCGNEKINAFHKFAILYADKIITSIDKKNRFLCEECRFAAKELEEFVSDKSTQEQVKRFISQNICAKIPKYQGSCDLMIDDFLPDFFKQLEDYLKNAPQFCHNIGLCDKSRVTHTNNENKSAKGQIALHQFINGIKEVRSVRHPEILMSCLECEIAIDAVLIELRQNKTIYGLADDLRDGVCPVLPSNYTLSCNDFLNLYAPTVVYMTMQQFTSEGICTGLVKACKKEDMSKLHFNKLSIEEQNSVKCEACKAVNNHIINVLDDGDFRQKITDGLEQNICSYVPGVGVNACENLMQKYLPVALNKIEGYLKKPDMCQNILHVC